MCIKYGKSTTSQRECEKVVTGKVYRMAVSVSNGCGMTTVPYPVMRSSYRPNETHLHLAIDTPDSSPS
jgi:hypothetical protein